jgi:ethanolamine utilization protein EutN
MRIARVTGTVTLSHRLESLGRGRLLIAEALDAGMLAALPAPRAREKPMGESLVIYDELGAGQGQLVAVSEGREAAMPWHPERVPVDAYCAAILDHAEMTP